MSLAERRWLRLFTLCVLYVGQGIPWGFMALTLPPYLASRGLDATATGAALAMTTLPYSFKWVWGPVIDWITIPSLGRRRPWIVLAQGMMALTVGGMLLIPDLTEDLDLLVLMIFVHTIFNSLQDVAVDALAVDLLEEDERGKANGLMYASKYGGGMIGSLGMGWVLYYFNLQTALMMQAAILLAIMMVPLLVRERPAGAPVPRTSMRLLLGSLGTAFTLRSAVLCGFLMLSYHLAAGILTAIAPVMFVQKLGWTAAEYTAMSGGLGLAAGLAGAVAGGFLADLVGSRRLAAAGCTALALLWAGFGLFESAWTDHALVSVMAMIQAFCIAVVTVSLFALCMGVSWPRIAAMQFTTYMALSNFSTTLGYKLAGPLEQVLDYPQIYLAAAGLQLATIAWLPFIDPGQTRRTLPLPPGTRVSRIGIVGGALLLFAFFALLIVFVIWPLVAPLVQDG